MQSFCLTTLALLFPLYNAGQADFAFPVAQNTLNEEITVFSHTFLADNTRPFAYSASYDAFYENSFTPPAIWQHPDKYLDFLTTRSDVEWQDFWQ